MDLCQGLPFGNGREAAAVCVEQRSGTLVTLMVICTAQVVVLFWEHRDEGVCVVHRTRGCAYLEYW